MYVYTHYIYVYIYIYVVVPPPMTDHALSCPSQGMFCQRMGGEHLSQTQFQNSKNSSPNFSVFLKIPKFPPPYFPKIPKIQNSAPNVKDRLCQLGHKLFEILGNVGIFVKFGNC